GDGLLLSRTQPRPGNATTLSLAEIQNPMIDAYLAALPDDREPRILASRTVFVADDRQEALRFAEAGLGRFRVRLAKSGRATRMVARREQSPNPAAPPATGAERLRSREADPTPLRTTAPPLKVYPTAPPHPFILRSIELVAETVGPALGWGGDAAGVRRV